ncbi:hypothetical protein ACLHDF_25765 [Priestia aryabhattai]|uniref:hypothetical protein n=1 Tax=Priestia megaterium TaxID=1404 RepID=UPI0039B97E18
MKLDNKKKQIQLKYREEIKKKKEEKTYIKKAFIVAIIVMAIIALDYHFDPKPPPGTETTITIEKVE